MSQFDVKMTELADAIKVKNANISGKLSVQGMIDAVAGIVINPPSGEGADVSGVTATPADVLVGKAFVNSAGELVNGEIQTAEAPSTVDNVVTIPAGYRSEEEKVTVGKAYEGDTTYIPGTADTVLFPGTYIPIMLRIKGDRNLRSDNIRFGKSIFGVDGTFTEDGDAEPEDIMEGKVAYVKGNPVYGTYKPQGGSPVDLSFITAEAGDIRSGKVGADRNGNPVAGTLVPQSGGGGESSIEFYECASYTPDADAYTKYSFTLSGAPDELANGNYVRSKYVENIGDDIENITASIWKNDKGYSFVEEYESGGWRYYIKNSTGDYIYGLDSAMPRLTDFNSEYWVDWDMWESVTLNFSAWQTEEMPATTEGWTGYKVTQNAETGAWETSDMLTTGLTVTHLKPQVGEIYSADTSISVRKMYDGAVYPITSDGLVFYAPLQTDYVDQISGKAAPVIGGTFTTHNGLSCLQLDGSGYVKWADNSDLPVGTSACSLVLIASPIDQSSWRYYMGIGQPGNGQHMSIAASEGRFMDRSTYLENGIWQTLIITRTSDGSCKDYVDGKLVGTSNRLDNFPTPSCMCVGAAMWDNFSQKANSYVAFAAVYNRELSADEVAEIHNTLMEDVEQ